MNASLTDLLCCPFCGGNLTAESGHGSPSDILHCRCGDYPVVAGIPILKKRVVGSTGIRIAEVIKLYDETTDTQLKDALMGVLGESGEKQAMDKLMQIARTDESSTMRRKAINVLSRSSDERVKKFLLDLAER